MKECIFCDSTKVEQLRVLDLPGFVVMANLYPISPYGHFLICSKRHVTNLRELNWREKILFGWAVLAVYRRLRKNTSRSLNFIINEGREAEQTIPHFHAHFIIRDIGDEIQPFKKKTGRVEINGPQLKYFHELISGKQAIP